MILSKFLDIVNVFRLGHTSKPILVWNLDEDKQEDSLYNITGVHWVDELGATVIKVKRKKQ